MSTALRSKSPIAPKNKPKTKLKAESQPKPRRPKTTPKFAPESLVIHFGPLKDKITDDEFFEFCASNWELRIEMTKEGDMIIMMPTGSEGGSRNFNLAGNSEFG